jgi:hypothetical protein
MGGAWMRDDVELGDAVMRVRIRLMRSIAVFDGTMRGAAARRGRCWGPHLAPYYRGSGGRMSGCNGGAHSAVLCARIAAGYVTSLGCVIATRRSAAHRLGAVMKRALECAAEVFSDALSLCLDNLEMTHDPGDDRARSTGRSSRCQAEAEFPRSALEGGDEAASAGLGSLEGPEPIDWDRPGSTHAIPHLGLRHAKRRGECVGGDDHFPGGFVDHRLNANLPKEFQ